jgi:predicted ribosome quality control (RQC) complex YloA/Tae2 family protein
MENYETMREKELSLFRIFKLGNGFEVWVGKNSDANDLLTLKYSKQNDLWFHIKSTSGSHTILKIPENSTLILKDYIYKAASIAAYYSKSKNAARVSVTYTQVKNVRKYKGAKSGSVIIKNEKVIKVEPKLPGKTENADD